MMTGLILKFLMLYVGALPAYAAPNLLSEGPGAEAAVFGRSAASVVQDPTSLYWNPAGLAGAGGAVTGEHEFLYAGARYDFLGLTVPSRLGTFGLGALQLYRGDIIARSAVDDPGYAVSASQADYMAGYAKGFGEHWSGGATVNVLDSNLAGRHDRGFGLDAGGRFTAAGDDVWVLRRPQWSAGAVIKNLLAPSLRLDQDPEVLPRELRGGVSVAFDGLSRLSLAAGAIHKDRAMVGLGFSKTLGETEVRLGMGASYTLQDVLTLRLGLEDGFAVGLGFKTADGRFSIDYALEDRPLTQNHRFTLTYRFLRPQTPTVVPASEIPDDEYVRAKARAEALGDEALARGRELFKAARYAEAAESSGMAALLKPEDGGARDFHSRAVEVQRREELHRLREDLDRQDAGGDWLKAYETLAALLRRGPDDRESLLTRAPHVADHLDAETRDRLSWEFVAVATEAIHADLTRGLDSAALAEADWLGGVTASMGTTAYARGVRAETERAAAAHRARLHSLREAARKAGRLDKAVFAAGALARAYPDDAALRSDLEAARAGFAAASRLTAKDRVYARKLYYLAATAWSRRDAEGARDLLDESRRKDAADADDAALMDAMVRAGAVYEKFEDNGGGL
jgi:hypothetical protein